MSLHTENTKKAFIKTVQSCKGGIVIVDDCGTSTEIDPATGTAALESILNRSDFNFELFCVCNQDEGKFFAFFNQHPEAL